MGSLEKHLESQAKGTKRDLRVFTGTAQTAGAATRCCIF